MRAFILILLFNFPLPGQAATWAEVQKSRDYLDAKKHLADYLPDLAIPRIKALLVQPDLDETAKASLLTLLAEAQIRHALVSDAATRSALLAAALKTLDDRSLREFSPGHLWRSYALTNLGRFEDAIQELKRIDRQAMMAQADLEMASLMITLGNTTEARGKLEPLLELNDPALKKKANLQLISVDLLESQLDEADKRLADFKPEGLREEGLQRYLTGRLQLARGQRLLAAGTFQELLAAPDLVEALPAPLYHETTLAVADSLALDNGEESAVTSLLKTLEKHPDSPRLAGIFARLKTWAPKIETGPVIDKLSTPDISTKEEEQPEQPDPSPPAPTPPPRETFPPHKLYAIEFLATLNLRSEDPTLQARGVAQLELLQKSISPDSPLLNRALLELAMMYLGGKEFEKSLAALKQIIDGPAPPRLKAYATALSGTVSFARDDPAKASEAFLEATGIAKKVGESELRSISELNAGITLLAVTRSKDLDAMTRNLESPEAKSFLVLERGLYLSTRKDPAARDLLASFIANFPTSPRRNEAVLALAESATFTEPVDPDLAKLQITPLKFDFETQPLLEARRLLVLLSLNLGREQAIDFLAKAKDHPLAPRILFRLAQSYRLGDDKEIGSAYQAFERFLSDYPDNEFTEAARYFSALSALSSDTESAQKKAILRFRELMEKKGVLANEAAIALASLLIDRDQHETALAEIITALKITKLSDSDRRRFLIMGADASGQLGNYEDVLDYYKRLLKIKNLPISTRNRASFQRGQALEVLGRKAEALESYLSVVNRDFNPGQTSSLEWKWFDKCGLEGALALLENEKRWRAAISLAEKLGRSGSPRAKDAREAAERIGLEQRIWRDR